MRKPDIPDDEKERLAKLDSLGIIYSPAEQRFDRITQLARTAFNVPIALVSLVSEKCQWFKSSQGLLAAETPREISFCGHAILSPETLVVPDTLLNPDFADNPLVTGEPFIRFYAGHPLEYEGYRLGTLCIIDRVPREFSVPELETLQSLAAWAENELAVSALSETQNRLLSELQEARREALIDPLTKVWNRKGMDELLHREIAAVQRQQKGFSVMLLDVDHYKEINDRHGHLVGDLVLKEIAGRIRAAVRPNDVLARYGGDEFFVFTANSGDDTAMTVANRILSRITAEPIQVEHEAIALSVSIGVASARQTRGAEIDRLIELADAALYAAKEAGRNRVEFRTI